MTRKPKNSQPRFCFVDIETLVPENHPLRALRDVIDFSFIYDEVKPYYKPIGRPSIDPVLLIKMLLLGYLFGIPSERRLEQEVQVNLAYRLFLGLELNDPVPDHSTFSYNRRTRFAQADVFQKIFDRIVQICIEKGLVNGELVVTDSTHIRANVNPSETTVVTVKQTPQAYIKELERVANEVDKQLPGGEKRSERKALAKKDDEVEVRISPTDPDARWMGRPRKPHGLHYLDHITVDALNGFVLDAHVTPGNVIDHTPCIERLEHIEKSFGLKIKEFGADAGYDATHLHNGLAALNITGYIPRVRHKTDATTFTYDQFTYVSAQDHFVCPQGKILKPIHVSQGTLQKVYAARPRDCNECPLKSQCVPATGRAKCVTRALYQDDAERTYRLIGTDRYKEVQKKRRIWCEGTFGIMKSLHKLRRATLRGIKKVQEQVHMTAIAVNLRRLAKVLANLLWRKIILCTFPSLSPVGYR